MLVVGVPDCSNEGPERNGFAVRDDERLACYAHGFWSSCVELMVAVASSRERRVDVGERWKGEVRDVGPFRSWDRPQCNTGVR